MRLRPRSYFLIVLVTILTVTSSKIYAAFPLKPSQTTTPNTETVAHQTDVDFKALVTSAVERFTQRPAPAHGHRDGWESAGLGIASLGLGLAGLTALLASAFVAAPFLLGLLGFSILAGIMAVILGSKGLEEPKRGFAIAGLVLGIVDLSALLLLGFAVLLVLLVEAVFFSGGDH